MEYTLMPFRMKITLATYQRMINTVVWGVQDCDAYIRRWPWMYSESWDLYIEPFPIMFTAGCLANSKLGKSKFCHVHVVFLAWLRIVGKGQVAPVVVKVKAIHQYPVSRDK